ncbi:MAG: MoaD/ThiS family protein [Bacteroidetes bacterium]|nr:MoaD/ThiS family protein [Bacteroidota bacterium]
MEINLLVFGQIADITGEGSLKIPGVTSTAELNQFLLKKYPPLEFLEYSVAINQKIVQDNCVLQNNDTVALLPPFSGG